MRALLIVALLALLAATAAADRGHHGSVGIGGALLLSGHQGDRLRLDVAFELKPRSRFGVLVAARALDAHRSGLVLAGIVFEGAAARPRLVLDLHASLGADLDARAPVGGGGLRTTLTLYKLVGIVLDLGGYLVVDGFDDTRLQIQSTTFLVARW